MESEASTYFSNYVTGEGEQLILFLHDRGADILITEENAEKQMELTQEAYTDYAIWVYARNHKLTVFEAMRDVLLRRFRYEDHERDFPNHIVNYFFKEDQ